MDNVSLFIAFGAGILSFFSPCILPLLPVYMSFITGLSVDELKFSNESAKKIKNVIIRICVFICGFSIIFISLGVFSSFLGNFMFQNKQIIRIIGGIIIMIFGLNIMGLLKLKFLQYEKKFHMSKVPRGVIGPFIIGMLFGFGWTPCVGPILGSILAIAATSGKVLHGALLLTVYSLGLALPFLLTGLFIDWLLARFVRISKYLKTVSFFSGILLLIIGILMILGLIF